MVSTLVLDLCLLARPILETGIGRALVLKVGNFQQAKTLRTRQPPSTPALLAGIRRQSVSIYRVLRIGMLRRVVTGILLTSWTIRLALACYALVLYGSLRWDCCQAWSVAARWLWTVGGILLLAHVACAFHFFHDWQHSRAAADTARQTAELIGWSFGGGVYFNYAFVLLWVVDASWWWAHPDSYARRSRLLAFAVQSYLFFIAINGAIVFEDGPTRWIGLIIVATLSYHAIRRLVSGRGAKLGCATISSR